MRVITEETDYTSEPYSLPLTPKSSEMINNYYAMMQYYPNKDYNSTRNKRSITTEESKAFIIDFDKIEVDGRTTVMVKNIPNKYTQDILLSEFSINYEKTFDFFYLPIDKDVTFNLFRMSVMWVMRS